MDKKLVLFDLDGVLIDSRVNMEYSWISICKKNKINVKFEDYFSKIGRPFKDILDILGIQENQSQIEKSFNNESTKLIHLVLLYDGVMETLNYIKSKEIKMGIVTSKNEIKTKKTIDFFELSFDIVQSPNKNLRGKPSPDHLIYAMKKLNVEAKDTVFIGDMDVDLMAAKSAKIDFIHAAWGYGSCEDSDVLKLSRITQLKEII